MSEPFTAGSGGWSFAVASTSAIPAGLPDVPNDLRIDVEVVDLRTVRLVPKSRLAADLLKHATLWGEVSVCFQGAGFDPKHLKYVEVRQRKDGRGVLASSNDVQSTGMSLSPAEYDVARAAVVAHREERAPKPKAARAKRKVAQ